MTEYLVLQKLSPSKILETIKRLRKLPEGGIEGIDSYHTVNIFGTWDVGVWFNAEDSSMALDFVHNKLKNVSGVVDSYVLSMFPQSKGMTEYLVLLKLSPSKILETIKTLRKLPEDGIEGIDSYHTVNIFGTWDVGVWFNAEDSSMALDFVHNKLKNVSGVVESYVLSMFPNYPTAKAPASRPKKNSKSREAAIIEADIPITEEATIIEAKH